MVGQCFEKLMCVPGNMHGMVHPGLDMYSEPPGDPKLVSLAEKAGSSSQFRAVTIQQVTREVKEQYYTHILIKQL